MGGNTGTAQATPGTRRIESPVRSLVIATSGKRELARPNDNDKLPGPPAIP
jgi:hypothetical protein